MLLLKCLKWVVTSLSLTFLGLSSERQKVSLSACFSVWWLQNKSSGETRCEITERGWKGCAGKSAGWDNEGEKYGGTADVCEARIPSSTFKNACGATNR